MNKKITIIILAGGEGKRIWPYNYKGKSSNNVCGKNFLEQAVLHSEKISDDINIIYDEKNSSSIKNLISRNNIKLHKLEGDSQISVLQKWFESNKVDGDLLIYEASTFLPSYFDMKEIISDQDLTLLIKKEENKTNLQTGLSFNSKNNKIFLNPRAHYVDSKIAGVYLIKNKYIDFIKHGNSDFINLSIGVPPSSKSLVANSINMILEKTSNIKIIESNNWIDIKYPWNIAEAFFMEMKDKNFISQEATIEEGAKIGKNCFIDKGAFIDSKSIIEDNCYIGKNAQITNGAIIRSDTHIGEGTKIGFKADVEGFLMENISIVHYGEINAMIGKGCDIGAGTFVGALKFNDKNPLFKIEKTRFTGDTIYPCFIGNHVRTGVGVLTLPGVIIGNETAISPGAIVKENIEDNTLLIVEQPTTTKKIPWGFKKFGGD